MAVGDVLAVKIKATAAGTIVFQPAAGVEYAITALLNSAGTVQIYDGTDAVNISAGTTTTGMGLGLLVSGTSGIPGGVNKLFITNSVYLALNASAAGQILYIFGVQTK